MKIYYVYILKCSDNTYYTGITSNLSKQVEQHSSGKYLNSYTFKRRPLELVYYVEFIDINLAIAKEKQLKKWSKDKKKALIDQKLEQLPNLSKKKFKE